MDIPSRGGVFNTLTWERINDIGYSPSQEDRLEVIGFGAFECVNVSVGKEQ
jgi:hypothetical protein